MTKIKNIRVRISTSNVGRNFGTVGVLKALNGRTIATTEPRPYGFTTACEDAARALAERLGHTVVA